MKNGYVDYEHKTLVSDLCGKLAMGFCRNQPYAMQARMNDQPK